jgi:hypothetical protein
VKKMDLNIYKKVSVNLTPVGMKVLAESFDKIIKNECNYKLEGRKLETQLYIIMSLFGDYLFDHYEHVFEHDLIEVVNEE